MLHKFFNSYQAHLGTITGMIGGMGKYIFIGIHASFFIKLLEAGVTAFACGILGAAGKIAADYLKIYFDKKKLNKQNGTH
jgi:hypothetical protein